jgi:3'(2'), 5'-bisphosphate nucleotidase
VAAGEADLYLQPGHAGKLWDTCAPEAIVKAAGGVMTDGHGRPFDYRRAELTNKDGLVAANPLLHARVI